MTTTKCKDCGGFGFGTTSDMLHPWREKDITCQTCGGTGEIIEQEDVMSECVTHHHACDCREAKFAKLEADLAAAQRELAAYREPTIEDAVELDNAIEAMRSKELLYKRIVTALNQLNFVRKVQP